MKRKIVSMFLCFVMIATFIVPAVEPALATSGNDNNVYQAGQAVTEVSLPSNETAEIYVDGDNCDELQWQILIPNSKTWANIYNEDSEKLTLSSALVANVLNDKNVAYVRCAMMSNGATEYSTTVAVTIGNAEFEEPENTANKAVKMFATPKSTENVTIKINYVFEDGTEAAQSWKGTFVKGSSYDLYVESPEVKGYVTDTAVIEETFESIDENKTYTVVYKPTYVKYVVKHFKQNVSGEGYTEVTSDRVEHNDKYANDPVGEGHANTYTGFKTLEYDTTMAIAADGSTELNIYYDRLYYLMLFNLDGGFGVEPIYAPYGAEIPDDLTPEKAGYEFAGWDGTIPATMPAENQSFKANWIVGSTEVNVNVAFWYENANDDGYTFVGSAKTNVTYTDEGATVTPSQFTGLEFTGKDDIHFTFNEDKNTEVELKADGTTIVNVYYTRNTYRLIFFNCTKCETNEDTDKCYPGRAGGLNYVNSKNLKDCVDKKYSNGSQSWWISIYTCKWQEDVSQLWHDGIAGRKNTRRWKPYKVTGASGEVIYSGTYNISMMNVMPDADIVFRFISEGKIKCTMNYWVTPVTGASTSGKTTKVDNDITYIQNNKYTTYMGDITENEEYVDIEGFTKVYTWSELNNKNYVVVGSKTATAHFFYSRNSYDLSFISEGSVVRTDSIEYEGAINGPDSDNPNSNYEPPYPSNLEPDAYVFKGWYLSEDCVTGTEVDWNKTMPVGGMSVYAKWEPIVHNITVKVDIEDTEGTLYEVTHGQTVENPPADPTKEGYSFISWFYTDEDGNEKPFTFEMPVYSDMTLYPKWKQEAIVSGTISYELKGGTKIADETTISALVGDTKTYDAKGSDELFDEYKKGYFPEVTSHNIEFDINEAANVYTFVYEKKDSVPYTVRYLEEGTERELAEAKTTESEYAAVVENFKPIAGYLPDLYKKTLILSANGENVLTFWYKKDTEHAPILRGHYLENPNDDGYTTYQEVLDGYGKIGREYTEAPLTEFIGTDIDGFTLNTEKSTQKGILTADGLELKLYYDRNLYPYEFRFVDEDGKEIAESVKGKAKFEATVAQTAKTIPGYALVEADHAQMQIDSIQIEEDDEAVKNVKTFVYKAMYADLEITKSGWDSTDENQTFVFRVMGETYDTALPDVDMTVTIRGNDSVLLEDLPVGDYEIKEVESWSWRYKAVDATVDVSLDNPQELTEIEFLNTREYPYWLSGDSYCENIWSGVNNSIIQDKSN